VATLASVLMCVVATSAVTGCGKRKPQTRSTTEGSGAESGVPSSTPSAAPGTLSIKVEVDRKKADGRAWDVGNGPPDIALCVTEDGEEPQCFPSGRNADAVHVPKCRDAFTCTFSDLPIALQGLRLEVFDVDLAENDTIGAGAATLGRKRMGSATITVVGDGVDESRMASDPNVVSTLLTQPKSQKAERTTKTSAGMSYSYVLPFCEQALVESNDTAKVKGVSTFRCESWRGRAKRLALGDLEELFAPDESARYYEIRSGALKGHFVHVTHKSYEVMTLAWVRAHKGTPLDTWLCENRTSLGYDRATCGAAASAAASSAAAASGASSPSAASARP
jgi:hypothetical protein